MRAMFPSSRLLPATVVVASLVFGLKVVEIVMAVPAFATLGVASARIVASVMEGGRSAAPSPVAEPPRLDAEVPLRPDPVLSLRSAMEREALPQAGTPVPLSRPPFVSGVVAAASSTPPAELRPLPPPADLSLATPDALKVRRSQIEEREQKLVEREAMIAAADKRLSERVGELTALQSRLQALEGGLKERDDANWAGMVKTYEGMRPKDAAAIFNALDKPVLLDILDRMKPAKATPVIAAMEPEKARQATADLSERRTRSTTVEK